MPAYDYKCSACNKVQEEVHSFKEEPKIKCKKCGTIMHRIIGSAPPVTFKGGGWTPKHYTRG